MMITEESAIGRQGRRMSRSQDAMFRAVNQTALTPCITAPEDEHQMFTPLTQDTDDSIGKFFPALSLMRTCLMFANRQCSVEQKHSLLSPACEIACRGNRCPDVVVYLLKDIIQ